MSCFLSNRKGKKLQQREPDYKGKWMFGCPYYEVPHSLDNLFYEAFDKEKTGYESTNYIKKMQGIVHSAIKNGHKSRVLPHIEVF